MSFRLAKQTIFAASWIRRVGRWLFRASWYRLRALGITLPPETLLRSPLDLKVGKHFTGAGDERRLLAVCDFACLSISYDVVKFLALADRRRQEAGCRWLDIAFVLHHADPFTSPHAPTSPITHETYRSFAHNLALDATKLFPAAGNLLFFNDRPAFTDIWRRIRRAQPVFPDGYDPRRPNFETAGGSPLYGLVHLQRPDGSLHAPLVVPTVDCDLVQAWLAEYTAARSRIVTITLRDTPLAPSRNSDLAAWQKLVDSYRDGNLTFVVLPDYAKLYRGHPLTGPNVVNCPEAVLNLSFRAALYQTASLNMMVGNGPATLCYLNRRARYIVTCIGTNAQTNIGSELLLLHGLQPGDQLIANDPTRRLVWEPDRFEVLRRELDAALAADPG